MRMMYARDRFYEAVADMVSSEQPLASRLADAAYNSDIMNLQEDDLPKDLREEFKNIKQQLTAAEATGEESPAQVIARVISQEDAHDLARRIAFLYGAIAEANGAH